MKEDFETLPLADNTYDQQFELAVADATALVQYQLHHQYLSLIHTEVPDALVEKVLHLAHERHLTVIPLCPFVARYIHQHPEWYRLVAPGYRPANAPQ